MKTFAISHKAEKGTIFITGPKKRWKTSLQSFSTNSNISFNRRFFVFLRWEKFLPTNFLSQQGVLILIKIKHLVHIVEVVIRNGNVIPPFIFSLGLRQQLQELRGINADLYREDDSWKILCLASRLCTMPHNHSCPWENFCQLITPNSLDCNTLDYCMRCGWWSHQ